MSSGLNPGCNKVINLFMKSYPCPFTKARESGDTEQVLIASDLASGRPRGEPAQNPGSISGTVNLTVNGPLPGTTNTFCYGEWIPHLVHKLMCLKYTLFL